MAKSRITFDTVRRIGLELAGVEDGTMYGSPALKLGDRLIACVPTHRSAEPDSIAVRTGLEERAALVAEKPETYYVKEHYANHPIVLVRLSRIGMDELRDLLASARRFVLAHEKAKRGSAERPSPRRSRPDE